jgi:hypothetical protein
MTQAAWTWPAIVGGLLVCSGLVFIIYQRFAVGLRSVPGPFIASFTDLWRLLAVYDGRFELTLQALHERHGDLVRVGPNCISVGDPREIRQIYGISRLFQKVRLAKDAYFGEGIS